MKEKFNFNCIVDDRRNKMTENVLIALLGIGGTLVAGIVGTAIGLLGSFLLQRQQRKWAAEDKRKEWRKQYREKQIEPLQTLVRTWLNNPEIFYKTTEQSYAIDLPRGSAWGITDENLRKKTLDFLGLIAEYYNAVRADSSEETGIAAKIAALCSPLETDFERYISEV
jgi:hypothetical protein